MNLNMPSIFIKMERGSCPYCGGTVRVLESEISETVLNSKGYPKAQESLSYNYKVLEYDPNNETAKNNILFLNNTIHQK